MRQAQVVVFLDSAGALRAESPGRNGARNKIDISPELRTQIMCSSLGIDLCAQSTEIKRETEIDQHHQKEVAKYQSKIRNEQIQKSLEIANGKVEQAPDPLSPERHREMAINLNIDHPNQAPKWGYGIGVGKYITQGEYFRGKPHRHSDDCPCSTCSTNRANGTAVRSSKKRNGKKVDTTSTTHAIELDLDAL